ncbi:LOW QUALITY PROTEIN: olfactory receptor 52M1-like [Pseudonaja textilis]|uniref:LOW QUALITY PROTEIN: olfactory receptor 52M1-like n=1 Tax=Pseudonaja textilis TaxID=8673 RepID=UPI000EA99EBA|nr:LOW QUALITY PROTEIN: olfactory receptor 52M1-like [Pseudonaja textilis]
MGVPQLETVHALLSIPFGSMYIMAVLGNCTILFILKAEPSLHQPMYLFLSMLAVTVSASALPKLLVIFWSTAKEIGFDSCLLQMFTIHSFATVESGIFLAMAYDRYMAICTPLRHKTILTNSTVVKIGVAAFMRGVLYISPLPLLVRRLTHYHTNIITHSYCKHMTVVMLSCDNTSIRNIYGMAIGFLVLIIDLLGIGLSYALILLAVMNLDTAEARLKSFSTCSSHICAILAFYIPAAISSLTHRFGHQVSPPIHILLANFYLIFPPALNPIVYTVQTQIMQKKLVKMLSWPKGLL